MYASVVRLNTRFVVRALIVSLALLIAGLLWLSANLETVIGLLPIPGLAVWPTPGPLPPAPTLTAPRGTLPAGHIAFSESVQYRGQAGLSGGSGFLLRLPSGGVVGATTAHSLYFSGWPGKALESVSFHLPNRAEAFITFDTFHGPPGEIFTRHEFAKDYVLLQTTQAVDESLVLEPDPRGAPQPGERVSLYSGLGDGAGNPRAWEGTVTAAGPNAVWAQMDEQFDPGGLSGSPLLSQHTGQVVGMVVAGGGTPVMLGFHPVASILQKAQSTAEFPLIAEYRR